MPEGPAPCSQLPAPSLGVPSQGLDTSVRPVARLDVVVSHHADRSIRLEHGEHHVLEVRYPVLAQGLPQLVVRDPRPVAVLLEDLPVVDQHDALAREQLGDSPAPYAPPVNHAMPAD